MSFSELLQDIEMPTCNLNSNEYSRLHSLSSNSSIKTASSGSHHALADGSDELRSTSPPPLPPDSTAAAVLRGCDAAEVDKLNPRMLTLSPIKKMKEILLSQASPGDLDLSKLGNDTLSSSGTVFWVRCCWC